MTTKNDGDYRRGKPVIHSEFQERINIEIRAMKHVCFTESVIYWCLCSETFLALSKYFLRRKHLSFKHWQKFLPPSDQWENNNQTMAPTVWVMSSNASFSGIGFIWEQLYATSRSQIISSMKQSQKRSLGLCCMLENTDFENKVLLLNDCKLRHKPDTERKYIRNSHAYQQTI